MHPTVTQADEKKMAKIYSAKIARTYFTQRRKGTFVNDGIVNPALRSLVGDVTRKSVLDIGCGFGADAKYFLRNKVRKVVGIDVSESMVALAKQNVRDARATFFVSGVYSLGVQGTFDVCVANLVFSQVKDISRAFRSVARVTKKGGICVFSLTHPILSAQGGLKGRMFNYFNRKLYNEYVPTIGAAIPMYHHTTEDWSKALEENGFVIEALREPRTPKRLAKLFPDLYRMFSYRPNALIVKARKIKRG